MRKLLTNSIIIVSAIYFLINEYFCIEIKLIKSLDETVFLKSSARSIDVNHDLSRFFREEFKKLEAEFANITPNNVFNGKIFE